MQNADEDNTNNFEIRINYVKCQTECDLLRMKNQQYISEIITLNQEIDQLKYNQIEQNHIWNVVEILFSDKERKSEKLIEKSIQSVVGKYLNIKN